MYQYFQFWLLAFTSLFTMMNPLSVVPVYTTLTENVSPEVSRRVAKKAALTAFLTLVAFGTMGQLIFNFFAVSINSLKIVGGVLFFLMGFDMLNAKLSQTKGHHDEPQLQFSEDIAITPLGMPMICGPGSITVIILLMQDATTWGHKIALFIAVIMVSLLTLIVLLGAKKVLKIIGESGNKVMMRVMGLIVMMIAVEFFFGGLKVIFRDIFNIK